VVLILSWVHRLLGEQHHKNDAGERVMVPPAETDWRWHLHRFFRSNVRGVAYARSALLVALVLSSAWVSMYATTGFDYTEMVFPRGDPDDPRNEYRLPFFVVESGSMMHPNAPWGRLGTVDPGDIVVIEKHHDGMEIETFYGSGDRHVGGAKGDVIMFLPVEFRQNQEIFPVIHRAIAYVQRDVITIPVTDPRTGEVGVAQSPRFTVEEFGIINARAINIPELGLHNYQPSAGGYLTRGDNPRANNWADQALGVTPFPVPEDRIIGRMKAEIPVIGLAKIALTGQDQRMLNMDHQWCSFLAGYAACDTWQLFFIVTVLFIGLPLLVTTIVFGRRLWERQLDRLAMQQVEATPTNATHDLEGGQGTTLPTYDATDLLSGRVAVGPRPPPGPRSWEDLTQARLRTEGD
jgi:signal peptidase I